MLDGGDLPTFLRFYPSERRLMTMPHAKNEIGSFSIVLTAKEESKSYEIKLIKETIKVKISDNIFTAFKQSPGPIEVRVGDDYVYDWPTIYNKAALDYRISYEEGPAWAKYSDDKFRFQPSLELYLNGTLQLGSYEIECLWNA